MARVHPLDLALADLGRELWTEAVQPIARSFVADIEGPLLQEPSTFRSERWNRTYSITSRRMIWGLF